MFITKLKSSNEYLNYFSIIALVSMMIACTESSPPPADFQMPPPEVSTSKVEAQDITIWEVFTGRLESEETVELRSRVSGYIDKVVFEEGAFVKEGQLLFTIDDRELKIEVKRLEAQLKSAQAQIDLAVRNLDRARSLKESNSISQSQLEVNNTQVIKANSDYDNVLAELESAKLRLSFTGVTAPISGRVSEAFVTAGNYVAAGEHILTSIESIEQIHAYFDVDEQTFASMSSLRASLEKGTAPVAQMQLMGEERFDRIGQISFIDNKLDAQTGAIRLRATFSNPNSELIPGLFARVRLNVNDGMQAILIEERAIATDLSHKYVLVVGENNIVEYRPVTLGRRFAESRQILSGLSVGDEIIVEGLLRAFPGTPVSPVKVNTAASSNLEQ